MSRVVDQKAGIDFVPAGGSAPKPPALSRPYFFPLVAATLLLGNAADLVGTYINQPNFEHEGNPLYRWLTGLGYEIDWPEVIAGKASFCLAGLWALRLFLGGRRRYYPSTPMPFREFTTTFLYGRPLSWLETSYRWPARWQPFLLTIGAVAALSGPYMAYLGYQNLANHYDWWRMPYFFVGQLAVNSLLIPATLLTCAFVAWLLWDDYRFTAADIQSNKKLISGRP